MTIDKVTLQVDSAHIPQEILSGLASGEMTIEGIQVRGPNGWIVGILKGAEQIKLDDVGLPVEPQLEILQRVLNYQQLSSMIAVAQAAAISNSVKQVEEKLNLVIECLVTMDRQLRATSTEVTITRAAIFRAPIAKLGAAKNAMLHAIRYQDMSSLIATAKDIEQAGLELLQNAEILVSERVNNVPSFLFGRTTELQELVVSAAHAFLVASDLHIRLEANDIALRIMRDIGGRIGTMINQIKASFRSDDTRIQRAAMRLDCDEAVAQLGKQMVRTLHEVNGRVILTELATRETTEEANGIADGAYAVRFVALPQDHNAGIRR